MTDRADLIRVMKLQKEFQREAALKFSVLKAKGDKPGFIEICSMLDNQPNVGQLEYFKARAEIWEQMAIDVEAENGLASL